MVKSCGAAALVSSLCLLLGACASNRSIEQVGVLELPEITRTGVQPGDQVIIAFYRADGTRLEEISAERTVDPNGELFLPYLGRVRAVGLDSSEIRELLEQRYGAIYANPVIEVVTTINVNITGAVRNPGRFFVSPSATLVEAMAQAGGIQSEVDVGLVGGASDPSQVRLVRDGVSTVIDMRPLSIRPEVVGLQVQSGDWLFVPRARRSQLRQDINFWGSLFTTALTLASLIVLIVR